MRYGITCSECGNAGSVVADARAPSVFSITLVGNVPHLECCFGTGVGVTVAPC